jgi:hypothetical protein
MKVSRTSLLASTAPSGCAPLAQAAAPQDRQAVEDLAALAVGEVRALAGHDDARVGQLNSSE